MQGPGCPRSTGERVTLEGSLSARALRLQVLRLLLLLQPGILHGRGTRPPSCQHGLCLFPGNTPVLQTSLSSAPPGNAAQNAPASMSPSPAVVASRHASVVARACTAASRTPGAPLHLGTRSQLLAPAKTPHRAHTSAVAHRAPSSRPVAALDPAHAWALASSAALPGKRPLPPVHR